MATSRDDITVEVAASQYRQAADAAYRAAVGGAAPGHLPGESLAAYRIRLADGLKGFSRDYRKFSVDSLAQMHRAGALGIAEETIYRDAAEAAKRPVGPLRERKELDQSGRPIIRFYGSPDEAWGPFKTPPRYVTRFNTRGGAR
jgi:hypothetical protein